MGDYKLFRGLLFLIISLIILTVSVSSEVKLSEIQKLKAENFKLKYQFTQCQIKLNDIQLNTERAELEREFKSSLGEADEKVFDWNSLTFTSKSK